jgi:hypothetical protein
MMAQGKSTWLRLCAVLVLLLGLGWAVHVYLTGTDAPFEGAGYVVEGGTVYETSPWDSRSYTRNLEYIGGKSAVLMAQLREWGAGFFNRDTWAVCIGIAAAGACVWLLRLAEKSEQAARSASSDAADFKKKDE